jgi:4'-phosphopantetheinyl transferase EntD
MVTVRRLNRSIPWEISAVSAEEGGALEFLSIDPRTVCVAGHIGDYTKDLASADRTRVANSVKQRQHEFSTGRYFARRALAELGVRSGRPLDLDGRRPVWPRGVVGSISHSDAYAIVVISSHPDLKCLGVDIEPIAAAPFAIAGMVVTRSERAGAIDRDFELDPMRVFSAKEAVFKAVNPITGKMFGFQDVEVEFEPNAAGFSAKYTGADSANGIINTGHGLTATYRDQILSWFVLD